MSCEPLDKNVANNVMRNHGLMYSKNPNLSQQEIYDQLLQIHNAHSKVDEKYFLFGFIPIKTRVSEQAKRKLGLRLSSASHDDEIGRGGGTYLHAVLAEIVNFHYNKKGNFQDIKKRAMTGEYKMNEYGFNTLDRLAKSIISQIEEQQRQIGKGRAIIHPEIFVLDPRKNVGGTIDVLAIFSDGTASIYDYKSRKPGKDSEGNVKMGRTEFGYGLLSDLLTSGDTKSFDLAMTTYKEILTEANNIKSIRQNRLVPLFVQYTSLPKDEKNTLIDKTIDKEFIRIQATEEDSPFLSQLPVGGERSRFEGLNKLLTNQNSQIEKLRKKYEDKGISKEEKDKILVRIKSLQKAVKNITLKEEMSSTIADIATLLEEVRNSLKQNPLTEKNEPNPNYPTLNDFIQFKQQLGIYSNIIDQSNTFFKELQKTNPEEFNKQYFKLREYAEKIEEHSYEVALRIQNEILTEISENYKTPTGGLKPLPELNWLDSRSLHFSDMDHPIFKEAWKIIQTEQQRMKNEFKEMDKDVWKITENLFKWAKDNGISRLDAYKLLVDPESGNLYKTITKEFSKELAELRFGERTSENFDERYKKIREYYELNEKLFHEEYEKKLEEQKERLKFANNNLEDLLTDDGVIFTSAQYYKERYNRALTKWIALNDLEHSPGAWFNKYNNKYIKLKPEVEKAHRSPEYQKILDTPVLLEYYKMWTRYMGKFSKMLNIQDYSELPREFIPNIRKELVEHFASDGLHIKAAMKEFVDSFNVREEDSHLTQIDETTGDMIKRIPILFMNPFIDKDGKVDLERKSYDLTASLLLFGKMAMNFQHMNSIEPKIQALKLIMAEPTAEQGGTEVTDSYGRKIRGKYQPFLTKAGKGTDTYEILESFTDFYLYGIKFKEKSLSSKINTTKLLLKIKNYNALTKLGFAIIPSGGAFVAGKIGLLTESKKGTSYTTQQWREAELDLIRKPKLYHAFVEFFDPYNDDAYERIFRGRSATAKRKLFSDRAAFWPLRKADEKIMNHITIAMAHNYGLDKEGNLIRLNKPGVDASLYTPLIDAFKENKDGEITIPMKEEAYIAFRNAVKKTSQGVIGNMNPEDVSMTDLSLTQNIMMQFKTWMPGVVRERTGKLRYDEDIQAMRWGRFKALADQFGMYHINQEDLDFGQQLTTFFGKVLVPEIGKLILDLTTFGLAPRLGMKRVNEEKAMLKYQQYIAENPEFAGKVTFDDFLEVKQGQMKAVLVELRIILGFLGFVLFLGGSGDDDKPRYMDNWATRNIYKILSKANSELAFMWSPTQFLQLMKNPVPMTSLLTLTQKTIKNGYDETLDLVKGENSPQDKSGPGYYLLQWFPGGSQLARFFELFPEYKKSPYAPGKAR